MRKKETESTSQAETAPITLPHDWEPYTWQNRVFGAHAAGIKRFLLVVHRRAGKDQVGLNLEAISSQQRVGQYAHVFPYATQVRKAIWKGMDKVSGRRFIDQAFPHELRSNTRDSLMELELANGSIVNFMGSDNFDALRGGNWIGVTFSEWAFCNPDAWRIISPILRENGGWAAFITTPAGRNHAYKMFQRVKDNPEWHVEYLTIRDTERCDGSPIISEADVEAERRDGLDEPTIQREYFCSWDAAFAGAYFARELELLRKQHRAGDVEPLAHKRAVCAWYFDPSGLIVAQIFQQAGDAHYCIGSRSWPFASYAEALEEVEHGFTWNIPRIEHLIPPVTAAVEAFRAARVSHQLVELPAADQAIQKTRSILPTLWIDTEPRPWAPEENNLQILDALAGYRQAEVSPGMLARKPLESWEAAWTRALAVYAVGHGRGAVRPDEWGPAPNYANHDRAVI